MHRVREAGGVGDGCASWRKGDAKCWEGFGRAEEEGAETVGVVFGKTL